MQNRTVKPTEPAVDDILIDGWVIELRGPQAAGDTYGHGAAFAHHSKQVAEALQVALETVRLQMKLPEGTHFEITP
jgi:hypothetical protein